MFHLQKYIPNHCQCKSRLKSLEVFFFKLHTVISNNSFRHPNTRKTLSSIMLTMLVALAVRMGNNKTFLIKQSYIEIIFVYPEDDRGSGPSNHIHTYISQGFLAVACKLNMFPTSRLCSGSDCSSDAVVFSSMELIIGTVRERALGTKWSLPGV